MQRSNVSNRRFLNFIHAQTDFIPEIDDLRCAFRFVLEFRFAGVNVQSQRVIFENESRKRDGCKKYPIVNLYKKFTHLKASSKNIFQNMYRTASYSSRPCKLSANSLNTFHSSSKIRIFKILTSLST